MAKVRDDDRVGSAPPGANGGERATASRKSVSLAKTMRPGLLAVVQRKELFARIDQGAERGVIWVAGPAGAGKTTLVSSYLEHRRLSHLWYQVDRGDVDAATFFHYMGLAAARGAALDEHALPAFPPKRGVDINAFSQRYFRELYQCLTPPFVLVFDNYQEAPLQSHLSLIINVALEEISRRGAVVVISRSEPPRELARLRANQRVELIGWSDLRLSPSELQSMARKRGQSLGEQASHNLYQRTQGWAAGAVLMLEHAKVMGTEAEPPSDNTPQIVFDYVAGEIFDKFEPTSQKFLLSIASLAQMTPTMAERVSGYSKAGPLLANLARNDYFVTERFVDGEHVYQFHRLLSAFLRTRAKQVHTAEEWAALVRRSGKVLAEAGQSDDAITLLIDEGHWEDAMQMMVANASEHLRQGRAETLAGWLEELPPALADRNPWVLYWQAAGQQETASRESRRCFEKAFEGFSSAPHPNVEGMALACCGVIDTIAYEMDDLSLLDPWIDALNALWTEHHQALPACAEVRVMRSALKAMLLRRPIGEEFAHWLDRALESCRQSPGDCILDALTPVTAVALIWKGHYAQAAELIRTARANVENEARARDALAELDYVDSLRVLLARDLIGADPADSVEQDAANGMESAGLDGLRIHRAIAHLYAGELDDAQNLLRQISSAGASTSRLERGLHHYLQSWASMMHGDRLDAFQQIQSALGTAMEIGNPAFEMICRLAWAETLASCGDSRKATNQLRRANEVLRGLGNPLLQVMSCFTGARISLDANLRERAVEFLGEGLGIGRRYGFTRTPWWRPEAMTELCAVALEDNIEIDYVRHLIRIHKLAPHESAMDLRAWPWPFQIFTLGRFCLMKEGASQSVISKGSRRPLELLKVLVALGGREVKVDYLTDILWPNTDGDYAYGSFTSTLHRLRRLLEVDEAITLQDGRLSLNASYFWVDTWAIEKLFASADGNALTWLSFGSMKATAVELLELYQGAFLEDDAKFTCYIALREHLRGKAQRLLAKIVRHAKEPGHVEAAASFFERAIDADPLCEGFYRNLMMLYASSDRRAEALDVYHRCHTVLTSTLKTPPSAETIALYERLSHEQLVS